MPYSLAALEPGFLPAVLGLAGVAAVPVAFFSAAAAFSASRRAFFSANVSETPAFLAGAAEAVCAGS